MKKYILISTVLLIATLAMPGGVPSLCAEDGGRDLSDGAVLLTFDDAFVTQWLAAADIFKQYDARATFFVSNPDQLSKQQIAGLTRLREAGHAIGCHSLRHHKAVDFAKKYGIKRYIQAEISPAMRALRAAGFSPTAFAYPNSQNNSQTDAALLKVFRHLRTGVGLEKGQRIRDLDAIFTPVDKITQKGCLPGKGIDYAGTARSPHAVAQICEAMRRAKSRREVLVLYAHNISAQGPGHHLPPEALRKILAHAKKIGLPAVSFDDLP